MFLKSVILTMICVGSSGLMRQEGAGLTDHRCCTLDISYGKPGDTVDDKKQDLKDAQSAEDDSATGPLQHYQLKFPVDCNTMELYSIPFLRMTGTSCLRPGNGVTGPMLL